MILLIHWRLVFLVIIQLQVGCHWIVKKLPLILTSNDSSSNFTGAKIYDWQKSVSDTNRGDLLKNTELVLVKPTNSSSVSKANKSIFTVDKSKSTLSDLLY